jgi:hypothetical protein
MNKNPTDKVNKPELVSKTIPLSCFPWTLLVENWIVFRGKKGKKTTKPTTQAPTAWRMESHSLPDMTGTKLWEYLFFQVGAFELNARAFLFVIRLLNFAGKKKNPLVATLENWK